MMLLSAEQAVSFPGFPLIPQSFALFSLINPISQWNRVRELIKNNNLKKRAEKKSQKKRQTSVSLSFL
jgi:hypothetical protein